MCTVEDDELLESGEHRSSVVEGPSSDDCGSESKPCITFQDSSAKTAQAMVSVAKDGSSLLVKAITSVS